MIELELDEVLDAHYGRPMPRGLERGGVMVHFDESASDLSGIRWLAGEATLGYTWAVKDNGGIVQLERPELKTPHAGLCLTPNANSHFYGVAALTNHRVPVTPEQFEGIARVAAACWRAHRARWGEPTPEALAHRIRGHDEEAIYGPANTRRRELWGKLGRKCDPTGLPGGPLILDIRALRQRVGELLA